MFADFLAFMPAATLLTTVGIILNSILGLTIGSFFMKKRNNHFILFGLGFGCGTILQLILCFSMVLSGFKPAGTWILGSVGGVFIFTLIVTVGVFKWILLRGFTPDEFIKASMFLYLVIWIVPIVVCVVAYHCFKSKLGCD